MAASMNLSMFSAQVRDSSKCLFFMTMAILSVCC